MNNRDAITARSILIGLLFTSLCTWMAHYSVNAVHASYMAIDHMPVAAISLFFFLVLCLHISIRLIKRPLGLSSGELLVIYIMGFVGCSVATMGLGCQILPILGAPRYYATPENRWEELILPHIKEWMIPQDKEAITGFFQGAPKAPIPWGVWLKPVLCWLPFLLSLCVVMICIPIIMRRQWMEKERLQFPLAQLPLEMVRKGENSKGYPFFRNKLMWVGFALPFIASSLLGLRRFFPVIPTIPLANTVETFRQTQLLKFRISFPVIGLLYLVNLDAAFSLWFFALVSHVLTGWFKMTGISSTENLGIYGTKDVILNHIGTGALVMFVLYGLWKAREHLKEVFLKTFSSRASLDDRGELLPYRFAVIAVLVCLMVMIGWLVASGLPGHLAFLFVMLALIIYLGVTRIVVECGVPTLISAGVAPAQLISSVGTSVFGSSGLTAMGFSHMYAADIRTFAMSAASTSLRIAEGIKKRRRLLFVCMLLAILVTLTTAVVVDLHLAYTYGGINCNRHYFMNGPKFAFEFAQQKILNPTGLNIAGWIYKGVGAAVMAVLVFMKGRFLWWPLHPVGWAIGSTAWIQQLWFSIFLAWLLKGFILKYGGAKAYATGRPFFLGLVLGQYAVAAFWFIIDLIVGEGGTQVFWI